MEAPVVRLVGTPVDQPPGGALVFGKTGTLKVPLRNDGNVATTQTAVTYELIVAGPTDPAGAAPVFQTAAVGKVSLKPGQSKSQSLKVNYPARRVPPGQLLPAHPPPGRAERFERPDAGHDAVQHRVSVRHPTSAAQTFSSRYSGEQGRGRALSGT